MSMRIGMCLLLLPLCVGGCVDRNVSEDSVMGSGDEDPEDLGTRPDGGMYAACGASAECAPLEFCVFPTDEEGFCTDRCISPDDASACAEAPGDGATPSCLDIALPGDDRVCALDCSTAGCPLGMRCEGIETIDGEQRICF